MFCCCCVSPQYHPDQLPRTQNLDPEPSAHRVVRSEIQYTAAWGMIITSDIDLVQAKPISPLVQSQTPSGESVKGGERYDLHVLRFIVLSFHRLTIIQARTTSTRIVQIQPPP